MNGRRKPAVLLLIVALALAVTGCQPAAPEVPEVPAHSAQTLYDLAVKDADLPDMLIMPPEELADYVGIEPALYASAWAATAADALRADAVMVLVAADTDSAQAIEARLSDYLSYRKTEMRDYLPQQFAVLEQAVLRRDGLHVALFVSPASESMSSAYQAALSGK